MEQIEQLIPKEKPKRGLSQFVVSAKQFEGEYLERLGEKVLRVSYDAERLLSELNKQRSGGANSAVMDDFLEARFFRGGFGRVLERKEVYGQLSSENFELLRRVCPDYTCTDDSVALEIFTHDKDALARDLGEYLRERMISLRSREALDAAEDPFKMPINMNDDLKGRILSGLGLLYSNSDDPTPRSLRSHDNCMDIAWEEYPGICTQMKIFNTYDQPFGSCAPVDNIADYGYMKKLIFNNPFKVDGYVSEISPDIGAQLSLLVFLKQRGHRPVLGLTQNPVYLGDIDVPDAKGQMAFAL